MGEFLITIIDVNLTSIDVGSNGTDLPPALAMWDDMGPISMCYWGNMSQVT